MRLMQTDPEHSHEKKKEKGSLAKAMKSAPPDQVIPLSDSLVFLFSFFPASRQNISY